MQGLTDPPRADLTDAEVFALLTADAVTVGFGLELLDDSNAVIEDISGDIDGGSIERESYPANGQAGTCRLTITRSLVWGRDRVRPYLTLWNDDVAARFNLGVYVLTTPDDHRGEDPQSWDVSGTDLTHLLQRTGPCDAYTATASTTYLAAARAVVSAAGVTVPLLLDGTGQDTALAADMVWTPTDDGPSYLDILNDLLAAIGYAPLWCDADGNFRSAPDVPAASRAIEWTLDTADVATDLIAADRTKTDDVYAASNYFLFLASGRTDAPSSGDGIYIVDDPDPDGPSSQSSLGQTVKERQTLDAADQTSLQAQGDAIVAQALGAVATYTLSIDPLPVMGHRDVFRFRDHDADGLLSEDVKVEAASWSLAFDGSRGSLVLGGSRPSSTPRSSVNTTATVTNVDPIRVLVDGCLSDCPASVVVTDYGGGFTFAPRYPLDGRVLVTTRDPQPPLVTGVETTNEEA